MILIFSILTMDKVAMCNVKCVACTDKPTKSNKLTQLPEEHFSVFQLIVLVLWFYCFGSLSPLTSTSFSVAASSCVHEWTGMNAGFKNVLICKFLLVLSAWYLVMQITAWFFVLVLRCLHSNTMSSEFHLWCSKHYKTTFLKIQQQHFCRNTQQTTRPWKYWTWKYWKK